MALSLSGSRTSLHFIWLMLRVAGLSSRPVPSLQHASLHFIGIHPSLQCPRDLRRPAPTLLACTSLWSDVDRNVCPSRSFLFSADLSSFTLNRVTPSPLPTNTIDSYHHCLYRYSAAHTMVKGKNCEIPECASGEKKCPRHKRPGKKSRQRYYKKLAARRELEESRSTIPTTAPTIAPTIECTDVVSSLPIA